MESNPAVARVQSQLRPKMERLIEYLNDQHEIMASAFFANLTVQLLQAQSEEDLLAWCIELSTIAFVGIQYDDVSWALADEILAEAEQISLTFTANNQRPH